MTTASQKRHTKIRPQCQRGKREGNNLFLINKPQTNNSNSQYCKLYVHYSPVWAGREHQSSKACHGAPPEEGILTVVLKGVYLFFTKD